MRDVSSIHRVTSGITPAAKWPNKGPKLCVIDAMAQLSGRHALMQVFVAAKACRQAFGRHFVRVSVSRCSLTQVSANDGPPRAQVLSLSDEACHLLKLCARSACTMSLLCKYAERSRTTKVLRTAGRSTSLTNLPSGNICQGLRETCCDQVDWLHALSSRFRTTRDGALSSVFSNYFRSHKRSWILSSDGPSVSNFILQCPTQDHALSRCPRPGTHFAACADVKQTHSVCYISTLHFSRA